MSVPSDHPLPEVGNFVTTACKGVVSYEGGTPTALFQGHRIFFCMSACLKAFLDDPKTSCLADEIKKDNG